jgi:hypothetical protein
LIHYGEAVKHLESAVQTVLADGKKLILTVSPVPLQTTFLGKDIVLANSAAKSILRALCEEAAALHPDVDYFPSFEMVHYTEPGLAWKPDGRHVRMEMVEKIMVKAIDAYLV